MKTTLALFAIYIGSFFLLLYPFLPGRYDTSGIAFSTFIQICCGVGLITVIDDTTYNLYFEQTRFFFDNFGTREFVVYNPKDTHLMMSHTVWHMLPDSNPARINQGWYASHDTGIKHWKSFWFD